jgi:2-polyprenyl-3-methyl-5-hydroxy-6-metoxy-1,4-benzoquinol methylase
MICQICDSSNIQIHGTIDGYVSPDRFAILECNECGVSWAEPNAIPSNLYDIIYQKSEMVPGYSRYSKLASMLSEEAKPYQKIKYFEENYFSVLKALEKFKLQKPNVSVAEIGCGKGYLTFALRSAGIEATGFDLSRAAISYALKNFGPFYECADITDLNINHDKYDVIICMELIEHLADPFRLLSGLALKLKTGGIMIISTPLKQKLSVNIWNSELPPIHLWWFSMASIFVMAKKLSMQIEITDCSDFYIHTGKKLPSEDSKFKKRSAVFDSKFNLLQTEPIKTNSISSRFKEYIRKLFRRICPFSDFRRQEIIQISPSVTFILRK